MKQHVEIQVGNQIFSLAAAVIALCMSFAALAAGPVPEPLVAIPNNPTLSSGLALVSRNGVRALGLADGAERWRALSGRKTGALTVVGERVLLAAGNAIWALDLRSGKLIWQAATAGRAFSPTSVGGVVYAGDLSGSVRTLNARDGALLWERSLQGWVYSPVPLGHVLVAGGRAQRVWALDRHTGQTLWHVPLPQEMVSGPVAAGTLIIITTYSGAVIGLRPATGEIVWKKDDPTASSSVYMADNRLLTLGFDGLLRARQPSDGKLLWQIELPELSIGARLLGSNPLLVLDGYQRHWSVDPVAGTARGPTSEPSLETLPTGLEVALKTLYEPPFSAFAALR